MPIDFEERAHCERVADEYLDHERMPRYDEQGLVAYFIARERAAARTQGPKLSAGLHARLVVLLGELQATAATKSQMYRRVYELGWWQPPSSLTPAKLGEYQQETADAYELVRELYDLLYA